MSNTINRYTIILAAFFISSLLISCQKGQNAEKNEQAILSFVTSDTVTSDSTGFSPDYIIDYDTYSRWKVLAKILYDDGTPASYALYKKLVFYMEQYNRQDPEFNSAVMLQDIEASFATIKHEPTQHKIDSVLYYYGFPTYFSTTSN